MQEEIFEKYPIPKAYFKLALPVVFSMVISLIYNMVDTYFIAGTWKYGSGGGCCTGYADLYADDRPWRYFWPGRKFFYFHAFRGKENSRMRRGSVCSVFMGPLSAVWWLPLF